MRFAGNVIWFVFGGGLTALGWLFGALVFALSIVGLPLSRSAFEIAKMSAFPFGKDVVHVRELDGRGLTPTTALTGAIGFVFNVLWLFPIGLTLCVGHLVLALFYCLTLIGIPFGLQHFKLAGLALWPVGRRVVSSELAGAARRHKAEETFARMRSR